jgi:hypothetical protein
MTNFIGRNELYLLDLACVPIDQAYPEAFGIYHVGSSTQKKEWRDVDLRMIFRDEDFYKLLPGLTEENWNTHARFNFLNTTISIYLQKASGLPVDFQFQSHTESQRDYEGHHRSAMGIRSRSYLNGDTVV